MDNYDSAYQAFAFANENPLICEATAPTKTTVSKTTAPTVSKTVTAEDAISPRKNRSKTYASGSLG